MNEFEEYEKNCDLFDEKFKKLLSKEVNEIEIPQNELPCYSSIVYELNEHGLEECRRVESNYAKIKCDIFKARYGMDFECCENPINNSFILRFRERVRE